MVFICKLNQFQNERDTLNILLHVKVLKNRFHIFVIYFFDQIILQAGID